MKLIAAGILVLTTISGFTQNYAGLKSGLNITNAAGGDTPLNTDWRARFGGGVTFEHFFNERLTEQVELLYNQRGYKFAINFSPGPNDPSTKGVFKVNVNYLSLPVKAAYYLGQQKNFFIAGGVVPSILIDANYVTDIPPANSSRKTKIERDDFKQFDFAVQLEGGWCYPLTDQYSVYGSVSFQHSFTSFNPEGDGFRHLGATVSAGIKMKVAR